MERSVLMGVVTLSLFVALLVLPLLSVSATNREISPYLMRDCPYRYERAEVLPSDDWFNWYGDELDGAIWGYAYVLWYYPHSDFEFYDYWDGGALYVSIENKHDTESVVVYFRVCGYWN